MIVNKLRGTNIFFDLENYIDNDNVEVVVVHNFDSQIDYQFNKITNKIVILFFIGDYVRQSWVEEILCNSKVHYDQTGKLKNYYIFLSVHDFDKPIKNEYSDYFTLIVDPIFYSYYQSTFGKKDKVITDKKLHFLSLNNRADQHRQSLFYFFNKFSLLDRSYFSYIGDLSLNYMSKFKTIDDITQSMIVDNTPWYLKNLDFDSLNKQIPLRIPGHEFKDRSDTYIDGEEFLYNDTLCSVITETYYKENYAYLTEKTFRSIIHYHPFILDSAPHSLTLLQNLGFETFGNYWDESYDQLRGNQRLEAIMHLMLEIGNWDIDKLNHIHKQMIPVLEHNRNHFFNTLPQMYKEYKPSLYSQIKNIVEEKQKIL